MTRIRLSLTLAALALCVGAAHPASALSMKDCSALYKTAQQNATLNGMTWKEFRKAKCGSAASTAAGTSAPAAAAPSAAAPAAAPAVASKTAPATATAGTVFPKRIAAQYASETAGTARMHTCLDQYKANKAAGSGNGGLKWIQKGGGYYSECTKSLKP
jgi:hypothetical protein